MKKLELKKIEEKELAKLQNLEAFFTKAHSALGQLTSDFEFKKSDIMRQMNDQYIKREDFKKELSEIYGDNIVIDVNTGEISEAEAKA